MNAPQRAAAVLRIRHYDISDSDLMGKAFSAEPPAPGQPRLRCPGDPKHKSVKSQQEGAASLIKAGNGVKITGTLPGPEAAGRVLVLQASALHGRRWLTFRRVTTGPEGGFRANYRFGRSNHTLTYRLRASVPRQTGYDYEPGVSKPARVKVRGNRTTTRK